MKILAQRDRIPLIAESLRKSFGDGLKFESFEPPTHQEDLTLPFTPLERCIYIFSDRISVSENQLTVLGNEISERPDEVNVAVRYQETTEAFRTLGVHADIMALNSSVETMREALLEFVGLEERPRIFLVGGNTSWTLELIEVLTRDGFALDDLTSKNTDTRLQVLFKSGAFDAVVFGDLIEVELLEGLVGIPAEEFSNHTAVKVTAPDLLLHLKKREVAVQLIGL